MRKISIIMPLYNAEKYLEEAITSVINQSYSSFELLCINDCSTDHTIQILQEYHKKDDRIRIIQNSERKGAAYSRNIGIKESRGDYLIFLDGDDVFDEDLLLSSYNTMESTNSDIVMFDFMHVNSECIYNKRRVSHGEIFLNRFCKEPIDIKDINPYEIISWHSAAWNKLYRKSLVENNHIEYQDLESSNDVYFTYMTLLLSQKTIILNDNRVMVYARDHQEQSRISRHRDPMCAYRALEYVITQLMLQDRADDVINHYYYKAYFHLKSELLRNRNTDSAKMFYNYLQKEGIKRLCLASGQLYMTVDNFIKERMNRFITEPYESFWFESDNQLDFYLRDNSLNIKSLLEKYKYDNKKIGIWGTGRNGLSLINYCDEQGIKFDIVLDSDKNKKGKKIGNYLINNPQDITGEISVIIVTGAQILEEVEKTVRRLNLNITLLDINMLVGIY